MVMIKELTLEDLDDYKTPGRVKLKELEGGPMARGSNAPFERSIQSAIIKALNKDPCTIVRCRSADSASHVNGDPDIYGSIGGIHVEIEVKVPGEKPTKIQYHRLDQWAKIGNAACLWTDSTKEALAFQKKVLAGRGQGCLLEPRPRPK